MACWKAQGRTLGRKVSITCAYCGKSVERYQSASRKARLTFCSRACRDRAQGEGLWDYTRVPPAFVARAGRQAAQ